MKNVSKKEALIKAILAKKSSKSNANANADTTNKHCGMQVCTSHCTVVA